VAEILSDGTFTLKRVNSQEFVFSRNDGELLNNDSPNTALTFYQSFMIKKMLNANSNISSNCTLTHRVHLETTEDGLTIRLIIRSVNENENENEKEKKNSNCTEKQTTATEPKPKAQRINLPNLLNSFIRTIEEILG